MEMNYEKLTGFLRKYSSCQDKKKHNKNLQDELMFDI